MGIKGKKQKLEKQAKMNELVQELYNKVWAAGSLKFAVAVDKESKNDTNLTVNDKLSCNLATILARDKEVVAVKLTVLPYGYRVYIAKNGHWLKKDEEYISKIQKYLIKLSEDAPIPSEKIWKRKDVKDLLGDIIIYCSDKLETRFQKLKDDIQKVNNEYVQSFIKYASIDVNNMDKMDRHTISTRCCEYYKNVKTKPLVPEKFLKHLKKVGSYASSFINITKCASKANHKTLFSNIRLIKLEPTIVKQPIVSWKNVIQKFIPDVVEYEDFKNRCLVDYFINMRLHQMYDTNLENDNCIVKDIFLHAEMNILSNMINRESQERESRAFIAVSKKCCYLCELYIEFAKTKGYNIIISGTHKKIYTRWKLPDIENSKFKKEALLYILKNLNQIIKDEIKTHADEKAESDSEGDHIDFEEIASYDYTENA